MISLCCQHSSDLLVVGGDAGDTLVAPPSASSNSRSRARHLTKKRQKKKTKAGFTPG